MSVRTLSPGWTAGASGLLAGGRMVLAGGSFAALFAMAYYVWWPAILVVLTPLALAQHWGRDRVWVVFALTGVAAAGAWFWVYGFFGAFSVGGLVVLSVVHGLLAAATVALAGWWHRRGVAFTWGLPVAWVAGEYLRMSGSGGLPVGLLAPVCREQLWMIQSADLTGIYGLSGALAMVSGLAADGWIWHRATRSGGAINVPSLGGPMVGCLLIWGFLAGYGWWRLEESERTMSEGPLVMVVQPDVPTGPGTGMGFDPDLHLQEMLSLSESALADSPELVIWPEAMPTMPPLNPEYVGLGADTLESGWGPAFAASRRHRAREHDRRLRSWVETHGLRLLIGSEILLPGERDGVPVRRSNGVLHYGGMEGCKGLPVQEKMRLFPWGETVPWREWMGPADRLLKAPEAGWFEPGLERHCYRLPEVSGKGSLRRGGERYVVSLCSEIMFSDSSGIFLLGEEASRKPFDFIANLSNDGAFQRNHALLIHNYLIPFRAVEGRVGIARSSNTGISCFVKPTGAFYGEVRNARGQAWTGLGAPELGRIEDLMRWRRRYETELTTDVSLRKEWRQRVEEIERLRAAAGVSGVSSRRVYVDSRVTLYSRRGDVLPKALVGACLLGGLVLGRRRRGAEVQNERA